jgi:ADP-heptose:LPS heptosyltransferase
MFSDYDVKVARDYSIHTAKLAFEVARRLCPSLRLKDYLQPPVYSVEVGRAISIRGSLMGGTRILAVHPDTSPEKMWDNKKLSSVLEGFLELHTDFVVVMVGTTPVSIEIRHPANRDRLIMAYGLPLADSLNLVSQADLFLGVDSCMLHAADFSRIPSVGLFGRTSAREFGFLAGPNITIQAESGMEEIEEEHVSRALESILRNPDQRSIWQASI